MNTSTPVVRRATLTDLSDVAAALSAGFADDPVMEWLFPDADSYDRYSMAFFACYAEYTIEHGATWMTDDAAGAILTMPSESWEQAKLDTDFENRMAEASGPNADRVAAMDRAFAERHPTDQRHLYGVAAGVAPAHRGRGIGTELLRAWTAVADREGLPCYGEATCERNNRLYERLGFRRQEDLIVIPGCPQPLIPIWRHPSRA